MDHDHTKTSDADFQKWLDEMDALLDFLFEHHQEARSRSKLSVKDGYPTQSMPESDIPGGRMGDPTADYVIGIAGGRVNEDGSTTKDHWKPPSDPIKTHVTRMSTELLDARNRLRGAESACRSALPSTIPDPVREQCIKCFMSKAVATKRGKQPKGWVPSTSMCASCHRRTERQKAGVGQSPQAAKGSS